MKGAPRTLWMAGMVALACAVAVSTAQVFLGPRIEANKAESRRMQLAAMLDRIPGLGEVLGDRGIGALQPLLVDLPSGRVVPGDALAFDPVAAATDPSTSRVLAADADIAGIGRVAAQGVAYLVRESGGNLTLVVLPIIGRGYAAPFRGYLALEPDLLTVAALAITEQGDTPGLGSRIQSPEWQALWPGTPIYDDNGVLAITVVRAGTSALATEVDGLTGATRSAVAVGAAVRFWLGPDGFGPFLINLGNGGGLL